MSQQETKGSEHAAILEIEKSHVCAHGKPLTVELSSLSEEYDYLNSFSKGVFDHMLLPDLSCLLPLMIWSGGFLREEMFSTLQDPDSATMLNEVLEKLGASIIQHVDPFTLRIMLASTTANILQEICHHYLLKTPNHYH